MTGGQRKTPAPPRADHTGRPLVTRQFIAATTGRHPDLVARHCTPVACDVRTRALLYDATDAEATLTALRAVRSGSR